MKNKLIATLLILTAVPFLANEAPMQQPTNAELLTHLKSIKAEIENILEHSPLTISKQVAKGYRQHYKNSKNAAQALYNLIPNNIASDADALFNDLCNQIKPLQEINFSVNPFLKVFGHFFDGNFINNHKEEIEAILSKYNLQSQEQSSLTLEEKIINCFIIPETNAPVEGATILQRIILTDICNSLLQKIDAKIAELACPSKL